MKMRALMILLINFFFELQAQINPDRSTILNTAIHSAPIKGIKAVKITFEANQKGLLHKHPCNVVGYVVRGTCYFQIKGESPRILSAGDAFIEPEGSVIMHFDNYSDHEKLVFVAFYLMENDKKLIELINLKQKD